MMVEHLIMQGREKFCQAHVLRRCDFLERIPKRHFQPNRRAMTPDAQRSSLGLIVALRLMREQMAHGFLSSRLSFFAKPYTCPPDPTMLVASP
jgi:hypothetical protein